MRICLLTYRGNMFCGGQGIYIYYLSRELQRLGHEVHVISGPPYPRLADGVTLHEVRSHSSLVTRHGDCNHSGNPRAPLDLYEFTATRMGVYAEPFAFSMRAYGKLKKLRSEVKFDVIHDNQCLGYGLTLMKRLKIPLVATIHHPIGIDRDADFSQTHSRAERLRRRWFYSFYIPMQSYVGRRVDRVITVSRCSAGAIERLIGVPADKISVVYNGVDTDLFQNHNGTVKEPNSIVFVGNTEDRKKGIIHLLQAVKQLRGTRPVKLTIVDGGSPQADYASSLIRRYGLESDVRVVRRLTSHDLVGQYAAAEIAAVPSLFEGFGFPAAEAMSCELPVITTRAGALPELVAHDQSGILIDPGDVSALAASIERLLGNEELRRKMGHTGRKTVEQKFNWENAARQTLEVYRQVI